MKKEKHEIKIQSNDEHELKKGKAETNNEANQSEHNSESTNHKEQEIGDKNNLAELSEELSQAKSKIEQLENEALEYKDKLLRKAAEFENYKRRNENDQLNLLKYVAESFIIKLLPIIDDFERSLQHLDNSKDNDSIKQGIKLVYEKFMKILNDQGVTVIDSIGKPFDVHFHEALMQRKVKDVKPHTVVDVAEKGYMYKDRVIRHAKVIVSEDASEEAQSSGVNNDNNANQKDDE